MLMPGVPPVCTGPLSFSLPGALEAKGWNGGWEAAVLILEFYLLFVNFRLFFGCSELMASVWSRPEPSH